MAHGESKPSRIYDYHARGPLEKTGNADIVFQQLRLANRYRNKLVELELLRREAVAELTRQFCSRITELEQHVEALDTQVEEARANIRRENARAGRKRSTTAEQQVVRNLRTQLRQARAELKQERSRVYESEPFQTAQTSMQEAHFERTRQARAECGLYWGTYLVVEDACKDFHKGRPPRYRRFDGSGTIAVQVQQGQGDPPFTIQHAIAGTGHKGCNLFRLEITQTREKGADKKRLISRGLAHVRVGSQGRKPVWATFPVLLHRPIPEDAVIRWVKVHRWRVGTHWKWSLQITIAREGGFQNPRVAASRSVGIDVGWRLRPDGSLRVACWVGSDGRQGEIILPAHEISVRRHVESLQSIRDQLLDKARENLRAFLDRDDVIIPEWLRRRTSHLHCWKSPQKMASLIHQWRDSRFPGDEEIMAYLIGHRLEPDEDGKVSYTGWRAQDKHLYDWQEAERQKAARRRNDFYRAEIARLCSRYRVAFIEDINWREMNELPPSEDNKELNRDARWNSRVAAVGTLVQYIGEAFAEVVRRDPCNTTRRCTKCGHIDSDVDTAPNVKLICPCPACGKTEDQDFRAAWNLLQGGPASSAVVN